MTLGLGVQHKKYTLVKSISRADWLFVPVLRMRYRINDNNTLRANYKLRGITPSLAEVSSVRQEIDGMQEIEGAKNLTTYNMHTAQLTYEYSHKRFFGQLSAKYTYYDKPIGVEKQWHEGVVLSTYAHQRNRQRLDLQLSLRYEVLPEWLTASAGV